MMKAKGCVMYFVFHLLFGSVKPSQSEAKYFEQLLAEAPICEVEEHMRYLGIHKPCQFPFFFKNQTFWGCTSFYNSTTEDRPWWSTKTTNNHEHITGNGVWGFCPEECPKDQDAKELMVSETEFLKGLSHRK